MKIVRWIAKHAAKSYIAGSEPEDAIRVCRQAADHGLRSAIGPWDGPNDPPQLVASTYKAALNFLKTENFDCYLSVKVPSIKYDFTMLAELADIARDQGIRIHFDSLAPDTASPSLALLEKLLKVYPNVSYTLPSRWRRSIADAAKINDFGIPVRVIKGQWPDPDEPAIDPENNYLKLIDALAGKAAQVGVATHDTRLAKESLIRLKAAGTVCELEQLYGLPMRARSVAEPLDVPVRVYVPYGHAYLAYALSAVRKRPIILAWFVRDFLTGVKKGLV